MGVEKAMDIYKGSGDKAKQAMCLTEIARIEVKGNDIGKVNRAVEEIRALASETGDHKPLTDALATLVDMHLGKDEYIEAVKMAKKVIVAHHEAGDTKGEAGAWLKLGNILMNAGDHDKAGQCAETALGMFYGINDPAGMKEG